MRACAADRALLLSASGIAEPETAMRRLATLVVGQLNGIVDTPEFEDSDQCGRATASVASSLH